MFLSGKRRILVEKLLVWKSREPFRLTLSFGNLLSVRFAVTVGPMASSLSAPTFTPVFTTQEKR